MDHKIIAKEIINLIFSLNTEDLIKFVNLLNNEIFCRQEKEINKYDDER